MSAFFGLGTREEPAMARLDAFSDTSDEYPCFFSRGNTICTASGTFL